MVRFREYDTTGSDEKAREIKVGTEFSEELMKSDTSVPATIPPEQQFDVN